jgi:hypothetical protein
VNCEEILSNSYDLEQAGGWGTQVIVLLGTDKAQSSEEYPSDGVKELKVVSLMPMKRVSAVSAVKLPRDLPL